MLFLLTFWLLLLFFIGTAQFVHLSQQKIASQARLDICTVRISQSRKKLFENLVQTNKILQTTRNVIYACRGLRLIGPWAGVFGAMGEEALIRIHLAVSTFQDSLIKIQQLLEIQNSFCQKTNYSKELALCKAQPSLIKSLKRNSTIFPDLKGNMEFLDPQYLGKITCINNKLIQTTIVLRGDNALMQNNFTETYEK